MAPFENTFQWSYSRQRTFEACKRQYYFQYYGRWNGWLEDAPAETRQTYLLSKMTNIPMLVGQLVHQGIAELLASLRGNRPLTLETLQGTAIKRIELARS